MDEETKKKIFIGLGIAALAVTGIFLKNKLQQVQFKPLDKEVVVSIIRRAKKDNYLLLKKIAGMAISMSQQIKQISPQMIKGYLESPESPIKIPDEFQTAYVKACEQKNVKYSDFQRSVEFYIKKEDKQIMHLVEQSEKDFETSLSGRLPQPKVSVPEFLTTQKILQIQKKLTLKKYLIQIEMYRKLKGVPKERIAEDIELLKSLPNPEEQEDKILEDEGLGANDQPSAVVFANAIKKHQGDANFIKQIGTIQNDYKKIYNRYLPKMQQQTMTEDQINQLEDQLIYFQAGSF